MDIEEVDLSLIVAMTLDRVIGNKGKLPWRLPSDLACFRRNTLQAGMMIMGHKTYLSILERNGEPLPGRTHVVITRKHFMKPLMPGPVLFVRSPEEALATVAASGKRAFVIGGGEIFETFLPMPQVKKLYVTLVHSALPGDAFFPVDLEGLAETGWRCIGSNDIRQWSLRDEYRTSFNLYERIQLHATQCA